MKLLFSSYFLASFPCFNYHLKNIKMTLGIDSTLQGKQEWARAGREGT